MKLLLSWLPSVLSTLFRLAVYIFLRVIPTTVWKKVLPTLYFSYIASSVLIPSNGDRYDSSQHSYEKIPPAQVNRVVRKPTATLPTLIFSLHSPSRSLRLLNFLINTLLALAAADFLITPFVDTASDLVFTRVGSVYPDSIRVVARYPHPNATESNSLRVIYRQVDSLDNEIWKDGPVMTFANESDWVDTVTLGGLWPSTSYEYILRASNHTPISHPIPFRTFPDPRLPIGHRFRFVVSSCITPNFPYRGPLHRRSIKGFDLLTDYLFPRTTRVLPLPESEKAPNYSAITSAPSSETSPNKSTIAPVSSEAEFMLFLGDFIYADVPLYVGDDKEAYRRLYRRNYQSSSFRKLYEKLPVFFTYDDHEFINNFEGEGNDSKRPYPSASDAYEIYNSNANYLPPTPGEHYYDFRYGDVAFFVMDTRRHRSRTDDDITTRTMLGDAQLATLHAWLSRVNETSTFKFVVSSVPFTSLWTRDAQLDSWPGFPAEKAGLLEAFHSVPNVMILSGDRHEFAAIEFNSASPYHHAVREFSTSPLSMFYVPFVRTLQMQSDALVTQKQTKIVVTNGTTEVITTYEDVPQERVLKYLPIGNYKWSAFEVDTTDPDKPTLRLEVMIDGKAAYHAEFVGSPVTLSPSTALGALVPGGIKEMFHRFGMYPGKWF